MRYIAVIAFTGLLLLAGCHENRINESGVKPAVTAVWECGGKQPWKFVLLEDGTLQEVIRADAQRMVISEGGLETQGPQFVLRYIFGPCEWTYDEQTNILKITVTIDDFYVKAQESELSCTLIDEFEGTISPDRKIWNAVWTTTIKYNQTIPDKVESGRKLIFHKQE